MMINTVEDIVLFSGSIGADRRLTYIPTRLDGVSAHQVTALTDGTSGFAARTDKMSVRIPSELLGGYVPEALFDGIGYTVKIGDFFIVLEGEPGSLPERMTEPEIVALAKTCAYQARPFKITDYSDNTRRGTVRAQHIRIVGE